MAEWKCRNTAVTMYKNQPWFAKMNSQLSSDLSFGWAPPLIQHAQSAKKANSHGTKTKHFWNPSADLIVFIPYLGSLCDQLGGIELGHHALKHLIDDRRKHTFIIVLPQLLVHDRQLGGNGSRQHTKSYVYHLKICDGQSRVNSFNRHTVCCLVTSFGTLSSQCLVFIAFMRILFKVTFASSEGWNLPGPGSNIIDDGVLEPRYSKCKTDLL